MRFTGKVSEFNRITGRGVISSKASGGNVNFHISQVVGGNGKLDAGAHVEFEVGFVDGLSQALGVSVMSRLIAKQHQLAVRAQVGKPIDEEKADFIGQKVNLPALPEAPVASNAPVWPGPASPTVEPCTRRQEKVWALREVHGSAFGDLQGVVGGLNPRLFGGEGAFRFGTLVRD